MRVEDEATTEAREAGGRGRVEPAVVRPVVTRHQLRAARRRERAERTAVGGAEIRRPHAEGGAALLRVVGEALDVDDQARDLGPHEIVRRQPFGVERRRMRVGQAQDFRPQFRLREQEVRVCVRGDDRRIVRKMKEQRGHRRPYLKPGSSPVARRRRVII